MTKKQAVKQKIKTKQLVVTRGRTFQGYVTKAFQKRAVIEFERTLYLPKYERFLKDKTRLHARVPDGMSVSVGDYVKVQECRPLSKIIHFVVIEVVKKADNGESGK